MANLGEMVVKIVGDITDFNKSIDAAQKRFEGATSNFTKLGKNLTTFVTLPILGIGAAAVKSAADMEMQQSAFETMLGSAEKAKNMLASLTELAAKTPFQLTDLADASKTMLSFGISAEKILPNIKMLGDIAQGDATKLKSLTLAFSQISSTGRLMGQDLLQLINAGFNPLNEIATKMANGDLSKVPAIMQDLKKKMEQGAISAEMVTASFQRATSEGGLFFNGMERASQTFSGQMSTLIDDATALARSFGEILLPTLKDIVKGISEGIKKFSGMDEGTKKTIIQIALLVAAIGPAIAVITKLGGVLDLFIKHPAILAVAGIAAAVTLIANEATKAKAAAENLRAALTGKTGYASTQAALIEINKQLEDFRRRASAAGESIETWALDPQNIKLRELINNQKFLTEQLKFLGREQAFVSGTTDGQTSAISGLITAEENLLDIQKEKARQEAAYNAFLDQQIADSIARNQLLYELFKKNEEDKRKELDKTDAKKKETTEKEVVDYFDQQYSAAQNLASSLISLSSNIANSQIADLTNVNNKTLESLQERQKAELSDVTLTTDQKKAIEEKYTLEREAIEKDFARKKAKIEYDSAMASWVLSGAKLAAEGARAIVESGPNPFLVALTAAMVGVQAAAHLAALPKPPQLAEGGIVQPRLGGVQATIAEAGIAEAVIPLDKLDRMLSTRGGGMGGDSMINVHIKMDSKNLYSGIFNATKNRTILIDAGAVV